MSLSAVIRNLAWGEHIPPGTETMLVVEDDEVLRILSTRILNSLGYQVIAVADGLAGLEVMRTYAERIHLILSDVVMPELQGPEFVNLARQFRNDFKVLYTSGYSRETLIEAFKGLEREQNDHMLVKPFTPAQLASKIREVLDHSAAA